MVRRKIPCVEKLKVCEIKSNDVANQTLSQVEKIFAKAKVVVPKDTVSVAKMFVPLVPGRLGETKIDTC